MTLGVPGPGTYTRVVDRDTLREMPRCEVGGIVIAAGPLPRRSLPPGGIGPQGRRGST